MVFKKQMMGLMVIALVATAFTGCTATGTKTGEAVASYKQGTVNETTLNEQLIKTAGMQSLLDMVDGAILAEVEPVTDALTASVDEKLAGIKTQYADSFEKTLQMNGFDSEESFKKFLTLDVQRQAYITKYVETTVLTEEEIKASYDQFEPKIQASHILIQAADDSETADKAAKEQAIDITKRINAGEDFAVLAKEFSKDTGSGAMGGDLGSFGKGQMVPEFDAAVFALKVGDMTKEPVKTQFGYHIIKKTGEGQKLSYEEMKPEIVKTLAEGKLQADKNLASKALIKLRGDNGLEIKNPVLAKQYQMYIEQMESVVK